MSQPSVEQGPAAFGLPQGAVRTPESASFAAELPPTGHMMPQPMTAQTSSPAPMASPVAIASAPAAGVSSASDDNADDQLDQEWINKAKEIVDKTRNDPFLQSREIGRVKADYLRTKYNKHLKVLEDKV